MELEQESRIPVEAGWSWAPYSPEEPAGAVRFVTDSWAPASSVRRPWVRVGRWTLLYRRPEA